MDLAREWLRTKPKPVLLLSGPTASGKTTLACELLKERRVVEVNGFSAGIPRQLRALSAAANVKTVADYAGTPSRKVDALLVEDAEFCDTGTMRAIVAFALGGVMPVVCVSGESRPVDPSLVGVSTHIRLFRPTLRAVADILVSQDGADPRLASRLAERSHGDLRQARIELGLIRSTGEELQGGVDRDRPSVYDAVQHLFAHPTVAVLEQDAEDLLPMMVAENYVKAKDAGPHRLARAAEAVSTADMYHGVPESSQVFSLAAAPSAVSGNLGARAIYPSVISHGVAKSRLPRGVDLYNINLVEKKLVKALADGAPPEAVAREMTDMGLHDMAQWEAVRTLAPMGREPIRVPRNRTDRLRAELNKESR